MHLFCHVQSETSLAPSAAAVLPERYVCPLLGRNTNSRSCMHFTIMREDYSSARLNSIRITRRTHLLQSGGGCRVIDQRHSRNCCRLFNRSRAGRKREEREMSWPCAATDWRSGRKSFALISYPYRGWELQKSF